jgi:[ribosomal protein S5]-alanine N-acetyltransferase
VATSIPLLRDGATSLRPIRPRDAKILERELLANRAWLRPWEATNPGAPISWDTRGSIRGLLDAARSGVGLPFVIESDGELAGQLNVSGMTYGSLASATIGYWVAERFAGRGLTPTAVALATDHVFFGVGLHRMEICIRPENQASLRVVEKLGFRYEGLRRRYIHINGDWRDHFCFALTVEEVPQGVLQRWRAGSAPVNAAQIPEVDLIAARRGIWLPPRA